MVSVVVAIWPSLKRGKRPLPCGQPAAPPLKPCAPGHFTSKPRASLGGSMPRSGVDIAWPLMTGADVNDANDVPSLPEPYGPDGAMADRGIGGTEMPQSGDTGRLRPAVRPSFSRARADLALLPHL